MMELATLSQRYTWQLPPHFTGEAQANATLTFHPDLLAHLTPRG